MLINKDSVKLDGVSLAQYLSSANFGYHKIWSSDSGRNMAYEMKGTLGGIFPKLTLKFNSLTIDEMHIVSSLLNKSSVTLQYYDPEYLEVVTLDCYSSDWEYEQEYLDMANPFSASIITNRRRVK